jgi:hypothetical protein
MSLSPTHQTASIVPQPEQQSERSATRTRVIGLWPAFKAKTKAYLPLIFIMALAGGMAAGAASESLSDFTISSAEAFIDSYSLLAPALIYVVLAPVLSRILSTRRRGRFGVYVIGWLAVTKVLALLWAVVFTAVVFHLPLVSHTSASVGGALFQTLKSVLETLLISHFFWAVYAAIIVGLVATRVKPLAAVLEKGVTAIEHLGQYMQPVIPLFMFAVGVYVQALPRSLEDKIGLEGTAIRFQTLNILGVHLDTSTAAGMVGAYVAGALLVPRPASSGTSVSSRSQSTGPRGSR